MNNRFSLKQLLKRHPEYWYFLFIPGYLCCYFLMEHLVPSGCDYWVSYSRLDDYIPFLDYFVIPYVMWYPFLFVTGLGLMFRDLPELKRYVWFMIAGFGFSMIFCVIFPNGQDLRPTVFAHENFFTWLLQHVYAADTNTNVLPSMHVIGCVAACIGVFRAAALRRWRLPILLVAILICLSTVFIKQHSILDIFAGFAVCIPLWFIFYFRKPRSSTKKTD